MRTSSVDALAQGHARSMDWTKQAAIVIGGSLFVALCAHVTIPLPFTPVPLTLQNFAVLVLGLTLGGRRGSAALALYLAEGAAGLPVFNPTGAGGIAQLLGPTGGFLVAYPLAAGWTGFVFERGSRTFVRAIWAGILGEIVLFAGGISWLALLTQSFMRAIRFGLYGFVFAEIMKVMFAAAVAVWVYRSPRGQP